MKKFNLSRYYVLSLLLWGLLLSNLAAAQQGVTSFYSHWEDALSQTYQAGTYADPTTTNTYTWGAGTENNLVLDAITLGSGAFARIKLADSIVINRVDNTNHQGVVDFVWVQNTTGAAQYNFKPGFVNSMETLLRSDVINRGTDNVFDNGTDGGNNIERIDFIFPSGILVTDPVKQGFTVMERGGNDSFKMAAITGLSGGVPSSFGTLTSSGTWSGTGANISLDIITDTLKDPTTANGGAISINGEKVLPYRNTVNVQPLRGMFFSLNSLNITAGSTIYGYSLVAPDANATCLNDVSTCPTTTPSSSGGLDLVAGGALFETADFGDAPASYGDALHVTSGASSIYLGPAFGGEPDSEPTTQLGGDAGAGADGDDDDGNDDEGAVTSFPTLDAVSGQTYTVSVDTVNTSGSSASLVGYLDFNGDGDFGDAGEQSVTVPVPVSGSYPVVFTVPTGVVAGTTYARFRIGSDQTEVEAATGSAEDGEVEDYQVTIEAATLPDYGDAPESYGVAQVIASGSVYLGSEAPDADAGNWHDGADDSENATDDDTNDTPSAFTSGSGEEDSVVFGPLDYTMAGETFSQNVSVTNDSTSPAYVRAWIDFDRNGTFDADEVSDEVTVAANAGATTANVTFNIPANSADTYDGINPGPSFARVIVSDAPGISLSGEGAGEVEDLRVNIADVDICTATSGTTFSAFDFSDFTALPNNARGQTSAVATFRNAAFAPDGTPLDVRVTVNMTSGEIRDFGNGSLNANVPDSGLYLSITGDPDQDRGEVTLDFFQAYTTTPYAVSGQFATGDIDKRVADTDPNVTVRLEALLLDISSFDSYALNTPTTIRSPYVEDNFTVFEGTDDRSNEPDSFVAYEFSDQTSVDLVVRASSKDNATRRAGFGFNGRLASQEFTSSACNAVPPPADYGDAPASYGDAQHAVPQTPELYLGAVAPDEESQPQNAANGGADGTGDDANGTDDEDAFDTLPPLATDSSSYTLEVPLTSGSSAATLYGWVDFDGDGRFSASEAATANVAAGASTATLEWNDANANAPAGMSEGTTFARLRLTTDSLTDEASTTSQDERASVAATDGEGEDYPVEVLGRVYTCPAAKADLWFANDESGSVDADEFEDALDFLYQISDEFIYDDVTGVKAGVTAWADPVDSIEVVMPITETFGDPGDSGLISSGDVTTDGDGRGLRELYSSRRNTSRGTRLDYATNYLADLIEAGNGRRVDTPQVAVILTDAFDYQLNDAASGGGSAWIAEADRLRSAGPDGVNILVIVTEAAAEAYNTNSTSKATVDAVAGANGLVVVAPTYAEAADATNGYVQQVVDAVCELAVLNAPQVDLSLSKEVDNNAPAEGDIVTFTLTLENGGPDDATGVEVTDLLPNGLRFFSASSIPQPTNYDRNTGVWNVGALPSGSSATLTLRARVETGAGAQIVNSAEITAVDQVDPDSIPNNRADEPDEDDTASATLNIYRVSPSAGAVVINEVLFDQSRSGNVSAANNDEFIELYNAGSSPVDLSGWQLLDGNLIANDLDGPGGRINGTLPTLPLLESGEYALIWIGERAASRDVPTAAFQIWLGQSVRLSDSGDDVWLYDSQGRIVDYVAYGNNTAINTPPPASLNLWDATYNVDLDNTAKGQSISLTPNGVDSNSSACWEPTTSGLADGRCPGYLPTRDADARVVDGVERVTSLAQNNNGFEKRLTGTLFYDDGLDGATANNALQEVAEQGVPGMVITATDGANTVSTTTDGAGNYNLVIPDTFGPTITLSHSEQPATGYNDGTTITLADTFSDADAASVTFTLDERATYNFGVVRESVLRPDQSGQVGPGSVISYTHLFTPGTLGEVSLNVTGNYTYQLFRDVDCDGIVQADEQVNVLASGFSVDGTWPRAEDGSLAPCTLELRVLVPEGEPSGRVDLATLSAELTYANNADVVETLSVTDVTTITGGGRLELSKRVANVTVSPNPVDSDFSTVGEGKPGEVLEYCISYQNLGTKTLTRTVFRDPVPFFTTFEADAYSGGQDVTNTDGDIEWTRSGEITYLSAIADSDAGALNSGVVEVTIGEVGAGETGKVCYRVRIR